MTSVFSILRAGQSSVEPQLGWETERTWQYPHAAGIAKGQTSRGPPLRELASWAAPRPTGELSNDVTSLSGSTIMRQRNESTTLRGHGSTRAPVSALARVCPHADRVLVPFYEGAVVLVEIGPAGAPLLGWSQPRRT